MACSCQSDPARAALLRRKTSSCREQTPTLREKYGFSDAEVEVFDLHFVADKIHGEYDYRIALDHATTVELQRLCSKSTRSAPGAAAPYHRAL